MADYSQCWSIEKLQANRTDLFLARQERLREMMTHVDMPAMAILDPNNVRYATGASNMQLFAQRTPARYLLLIQSGPAVLYEYVGCEHLARDLPTVDEIREAEGLCRISSGGNPQAAAERFGKEITSIVRDLDPTITRIGIDRFPFHATDALRRQGFELLDADDALVPARTIKLPHEIPYIREAMKRIEGGVQRLEDSIEPGRSESEVWAELHFENMAKQGDYVSTRLFQSGSNTYPYFQECGGRLMERGDLVCLDTDALGYEGYAVDFSRSFLCGDGKATAVQRKLYGRAREQLECNAALLKPGVEYREIAESAWKVPEEHLASRYYCIGHGLGMAGEFPNIPHHNPESDYPLPGAIEPGMIICVESYVGSEKSGEGVKLEDQFLVHDDRVERLSGYRFDTRLG